ncbi:C25 family cysteine peptidase [Arenicella xantha]|uniref:H-type lectin domain-containing protein n=1 Tax=Arenicella xantha TaxID=644221 RepID=A0A395JLR6_9GAMM|nr:C25 family cysteine peptidase [Arenicella xantha]RBP49908.1 H-type lectin domain-containing protein [Arenicella xantha]
MQMKNCCLLALLVFGGSMHCAAYGAANTFQVGSGTIHDTFANNSFDEFPLSPDFADTPAVFILGNTAGSNSCEVRLQNIDTDSFEAVCPEDSSWDGEHAAVPVQFAAIAEGVQTIPTNNGGSVTFEVGCVTTNAVQHNCTTGCDTESYEPIMFSSTFSSAPVVIANIQTVENMTLGAPPSNPIEPMLSVAIDDITGTGFNLALDLNKEDNVGSLNDEKICWLAVEETSHCDLVGTDDTLNFSAIGGPASVAFEAIITPDNIDGWDNNCNNTEEATFTPGCFTSTPVAIATKRGRQEPEGWLRYCRLNTSELRLTIDEQRVAGQNREHVDETASVIAFGSSFTTPVSLARFETSLNKSNRVVFEWETESESFNFGFNLWAEVAGEWTQLNKSIIVSNTDGLAGGQSYRKTLRLNPDLLAEATAFGLSSYDTSGYEEFFGPFTLGEEYGQTSEMRPIEWTAIRAEYNQRMQQSGYLELNGRWKRSTRARKAIRDKNEYQLGKEVINLLSAEPGLHRVSFSELSAAGADWHGIPVSELAITYQGRAIPRAVQSDNSTFDQGDSIVYYVGDLSAKDALYTQEMVYRIQRDSSKAIDADRVMSSPQADATRSASVLTPYKVSDNNIYVATSSNGDPWVDRKLLAYGREAATTYTFNITKAIVDKPALLTVRLVGGIDFPSVPLENPDHHVLVKVNGRTAAATRFDGFQHQLIEALVPASDLLSGLNTVEIVLPGDTGQIADLMYINDVELAVHHPSELLDQGVVIPAESDIEVYDIEANLGAQAAEVFAYQSSGNLAVLDGVELNGSVLSFSALSGIKPDNTFYAVMTDSAFRRPSISLERPINFGTNLGADYLIVAHPSFINADLQRFAAAKRRAGLRTTIVSWLDIVDSYGFGMPTPEAIRNFLKSADQRNKIKYVLIVGGHSYDYNNHLALGNVSFIPTMYESVSKDFMFAPTDTPIVDITGDGLPNKAIGRWPVRTEQDLRNIVNKTLRWQADSHLYRGNVLLLADVEDTARAQNFSSQLEELATHSGILSSANNVQRIYLDDYLAIDTPTPIADARADLLGRFDASSAGVGLTVYNGHSSSSRWTFRNLFNAQDASAMNNHSSPTFVLPLACYTTLYESPSMNSLAHQLLFASEAGAVALSGAAYLSEYRENAEFANRLISQAKHGNMTVGQAILAVKSKMQPWNDMVTNWSLLGDPSIRLAGSQ